MTDALSHGEFPRAGQRPVWALRCVLLSPFLSFFVLGHPCHASAIHPCWSRPGASPGVSLTMPARGPNQAPDDTPGHEFPGSEHDDFFADRDTVVSARHQHSLPSFPEAFGGPNDCHRQPFPSSLCPLHSDFLQQQYRLPLPPPPPANNVLRTLDHSATDLAPLHLGRNTTTSNSDSHNSSDGPCQTSVSETPALQWPDGADRPFSCLSHAPLHSQFQRQRQQQQPFDNHPVNPHPFISNLGGLDLDGLDWDLDLHHTHHCTAQQPPSTSQAPLRRLALPPTTTAPSTARLDHEYALVSNEAPSFSTPEQPQTSPPPPPLLLTLPLPQPGFGGNHFIDTLQAQIPGAGFDHFSAPYGNSQHPFPFWPPSMTSAPGLNSDSFEPEAAMPSLANPPSARRRSSRRLSNSVVDLTKEESRDNLTSSSPVPMALPPTRKRRRSTPAGGATSASNARRSSASQASKSIKTEAKRPSSRGDDTCVFGSSPPPAFHSDEEVLDLTEVNEVSANQKKIEADRRVKLSKFQCVICMDDVSNLTVTHCGKSRPVPGFPQYL